MMSPFWSLLLCLVLICGLQLAICHIYMTHTLGLHITHIIIIAVYIVILIFIYRIFVNKADNQL